MTAISLDNIYYLGPDGSNAHYAAMEFLKSGQVTVKNRLPQKSIRTALEKLSSDLSSICVLPIENSIEGIVRETIDNMQRLENENIFIQGEITIPIRHSLLACTKDKKNIKKIISHPQALAQCGNFLHKNFPEAELKEVSSTSYAAEKTAAENVRETAAIANSVCAKIFNLNILEDNINDEIDNKTRFYILGREKLINNTKGKTAILLSTKNKPGALCNVLQVFSDNNINITYIDSRPAKKHLGEYLFFMELECLSDDYRIKHAMKDLLENVEFFKNMGSFYAF